MKYTSNYAGIFDRGFGKECMFIPLAYNFDGSGNIMPPSLLVYSDTRHGKNIHIELFYVKDQQELAHIFDTTQQNISRWIKKHLEIQKQVKEKGSLKKVRLDNSEYVV